jgi:hypothetical protein
LGLELGWFSGSEPGTDPLAQAAPPEVENPPPQPGEPSKEVAPPDPKIEPEPEPDPSTSETGGESAEAANEVLAVSDTAPKSQAEDWCHLHEDHLTLLDRSDNKRTRLLHEGVCYQCRVEKRAARTRSFTPRDCEGYALCGPTAEEDCQ